MFKASTAKDLLNCPWDESSASGTIITIRAKDQTSLVVREVGRPALAPGFLDFAKCWPAFLELALKGRDLGLSLLRASLKTKRWISPRKGFRSAATRVPNQSMHVLDPKQRLQRKHNTVPGSQQALIVR